MTQRSYAAALALFAAATLNAQKFKSQAEVDAFKAVLGAATPDARIAAGEEMLNNFATTEFKSIVLKSIAESYGQKNDDAKMIVYGERAIEADPKNFEAMLLLSQGIARKVRENDLDKDERLNQAEKYAKQALDLIPNAAKPTIFQIPDDQWANMKKDYTSDCHNALGMVAMGRKKYDDAVTEFKTAVDGASQPDQTAMVRLAQAQNKAGKYDDAMATADKVMNLPNVNPQIKNFAQAEKVRAAQAKQPK